MSKMVRPRDELARRFEKSNSPKIKAYASFIEQGEEGQPIPCWGAIADRFVQEFDSDEDRIAIWSVLVNAGDRRPLLLFVGHNLDRPAVMARVVEDAHLLPVPLQCALASMTELDDLLDTHIESIAPAARQLREARPEKRSREREMFEERLSKLRAFRFFVPDEVDPADEASRPLPVNREDPPA